MKNIPLPYLRTFLILTLCVGMLGNAKIMLLHNTKLVSQRLITSLNSSPQHLKTESVQQLSVSVIKESLISKEPSTFEQPSESHIQEPHVNNEFSINKEPVMVVTTESITDALTNQKTESSERIEHKSLSELIESDSINSTIKSLEKIVQDVSNESFVKDKFPSPEEFELPRFQNDYAFQNDLAMQAERRLQSNVTYDGRYLKIGYPMGDVPANMGVCTDVVIRAYRALGIDLQQRVHEDMRSNFRRYPNNWQLTRPDSNIDHRRVPNLMKYFKRAGASVAISSNPLDYHAGDVVAWDMGNGFTHIGIVSTYVSEKTSNPLIVHNIGVGPEMTDILFDFKIIGHYRYSGRSNRQFFNQKMAKL